MRSEEEIKDFIYSLYLFISKHLPKDIIKKLCEFALKVSPSKAYRDAPSVVLLHTGKMPDPRLSIAVSKFTRWISVLARDYGKQVAEKFINNQLFLSQYTYVQPTKTDQKKSGSERVLRKTRKSVTNINFGAYRFGDYGAVGRIRASEILSRVKFDVDPVFALDVFHTFYLVNTALRDESLHREFFEELLSRDDVKEIRLSTVADEILSYAVSIRLLEELRKELESLDEKERRELLFALENWDKTDKEKKEKAMKVVSSVIDKVKKDTKNMKKMEMLMNASGIGHKLSFDAKLDSILSMYANIDVEKVLRLVKSFGSILHSEDFTDEPEEYEGYERIEDFWSDISHIPIMELMEDDDLFYYKYATGEMMKYRMRSKKTIRSFTVLVDKSGSMNQRGKAEWSRAVALALLMWAQEMGAEISMIFFDSSPYEELSDISEMWRWVLTTKCDGGTKIDSALAKVRDREVVVLITDGEDKVSFEKPEHMKLVSVMICGNNSTLRNISDVYVSVEPNKDGFIRIVKGLKEVL